MAFVIAVCTEEVFDQLRLPASLKESKDLNPIGRDLVQDCAACSALIVHPARRDLYPDRELSLYVRGEHFQAWLYASGDHVDAVQLPVDAGLDEATCDELVGLLKSGLALMLNEAVCSVPVNVQRPYVAPVWVAQSPAEVISRLNRFCDDIRPIKELDVVPDLEESSIEGIINVMLMPEEVESLEQHLPGGTS